MMTEKLKALAESRRFWAVVGTALFTLLHDAIGISVDEATVQTLILAIGAWVVGDSLRTTERKPRSSGYTS